MKIVVAGYGQMLSNLVLGAQEAGHKVVGVLRWERTKFPPFILFFKDIFAPGTDLSFINGLNIYDIKAKSINSEEFKKEMLKLNPDILLVGSWSEKLKKETINLPKLAAINCHPSLLPKYRGPNPYARAIMNGEAQSGITFHLIDENYDTGPILMQKTVPITKTETGGTLKNKCCNAARGAIGELLNNMNTEIVIPIMQNEKEASYFGQITAKDILIDFENTADRIDCQIRGLRPWQSSYIPHKNVFFKVQSCEIRPNTTKFQKPGTIVAKGKNAISVLSGDNKVLVFKNAVLHGAIRKPLTNFYIESFVRIGDFAF